LGGEVNGLKVKHNADHSAVTYNIIFQIYGSWSGRELTCSVGLSNQAQFHSVPVDWQSPPIERDCSQASVHNSIGSRLLVISIAILAILSILTSLFAVLWQKRKHKRGEHHVYTLMIKNDN